MANYAITVTLRPAKDRKNIVDAPELSNRYEVISSNNSIQGDIFIPKTITMANNDTLTLTLG